MPVTEKLMPMMQNGLAKLIEECGEVLQIAGKLVQYPHLQASLELHPDGTHLLTELQNELADVSAASAFVAERLKLDLHAIDARTQRKLERFRRWDRERPARRSAFDIADELVEALLRDNSVTLQSEHKGKRVRVDDWPASVPKPEVPLKFDAYEGGFVVDDLEIAGCCEQDGNPICDKFVDDGNPEGECTACSHQRACHGTAPNVRKPRQLKDWFKCDMEGCTTTRTIGGRYCPAHEEASEPPSGESDAD